MEFAQLTPWRVFFFVLSVVCIIVAVQGSKRFLPDHIVRQKARLKPRTGLSDEELDTELQVTNSVPYKILDRAGYISGCVFAIATLPCSVLVGPIVNKFILPLAVTSGAIVVFFVGANQFFFLTTTMRMSKLLGARSPEKFKEESQKPVGFLSRLFRLQIRLQGLAAMVAGLVVLYSVLFGFFPDILNGMSMIYGP